MSQQTSLPFDPAGEGSAALDALLRHAPPVEAGVWDELRGADGRSRPAWERFARCVPDDAEALDRRVMQVARQLRQDGVTHNVFSDAGAAVRPWSLELLPLLIDPVDWATIEAGVLQRAALLEAVLADCYGPRRLLHDGLLPPSLLLRHPGYLRPLHGVVPAGGQRLHIVAFDIARGADGQWWLVAQRTQGPSGLGYVMHNRLTISRQFPDAFRELRVQHIASSYRRLIDALDQRAQDVAGGHAPRIVLLTPGPYSETWFEQAYLARYLGLPLVEGSDLTVRAERLFLKTVDGLEPVHGVLRRVDDAWCDPLELRPESALGVPGLLQAARAGNVVMANALGSGFLETPALQGFLPGIAQRLLGQNLLMPALPTWWCGEAAAWAGVRPDVVARTPDKLVRSTFPRSGRTSQVHDAPPEIIDADPDAWTVQGRLPFSRTPIWAAGRALPRPALLRVYAIADALGRWHVLPGGMTRVAQRADGSVSMQRGGSSLDTWVMTSGRVDEFSMLPSRLQVEDILGRRRPVTSRTAENLFWLGRYTERTEQLVRLARVVLDLIDADSDAGEPVLATLTALAVRKGLVPEGVPSLLQSPAVFERALLSAIGQPQGGGAWSVAFNLQALAQASQALRERLSAEQWSLIRRMGEDFAAALELPGSTVPDRTQAGEALERLALQLGAVTGAQTDRMTRDHGWRFLTIGRLLDRLIGVAVRFEAFLAGGALASVAGIDLLLELFDSAITFRARYQRHEDLLAVADLLVMDDTNPRAYAGVLRRLRTELRKLPGGEAGAEPLLALLPTAGAGLTPDELRGLDDAAIAARLLTLSRDLARAGERLADAIGERYFALATEDQRMQAV
ncbi:circularly permuted type 2 ATP-grasp protein [Rubrivivax albus]|uniref:Uncharacterized protein n=1 Tax=Rubrivivax albus TaxID=2499835 RepID=A0A3S3SB11_9BURK|nr:circularly permuted type 2 ATP-grasp protein [Rubrivivax albus]RVT50136.1 hypothetical protein ENE75_17675 [Rubrivivax albus]